MLGWKSEIEGGNSPILYNEENLNARRAPRLKARFCPKRRAEKRRGVLFTASLL